MIRRVACGIAAATAAVCAVAGPRAADDPGSLEVLPAQGNVHVLAAAGGNTTVQIGSEGPLVVDTQPAALSEKVIEALVTGMIGHSSPASISGSISTSVSVMRSPVG